MSSNKPLGLVRVKDPSSGAEFNASRQYAKAAGLTVTEKATVDKYDRLIPAKGNPIQPAAKSTAKTKES